MVMKIKKKIIDLENQIINAIEKHLKSSSYISFYIGKTDDFNRRMQEHKTKDGYTCCWKLATGKADEISKMENDLISHFKSSKKFQNKIDNKNVGSGGNDKANILYVAFKKEIDDIDDDCKDIFDFADGFPLNLEA